MTDGMEDNALRLSRVSGAKKVQGARNMAVVGAFQFLFLSGSLWSRDVSKTAIVLDDRSVVNVNRREGTVFILNWRTSRKVSTKKA